MAVLAIIAGFILLIAGAELVVRGASGLALAVGIPSLIIGLTVVAFGTSAPELAVSIKASIADQAGITLGNVIGSNIFNILFVLGASALIMPLRASSQLVRLDVPIMIIASGLVWVFAIDNLITRAEGLLFIIGIIAYNIILFYTAKKSDSVSLQEIENAQAKPKVKIKLSRCIFFVVVGLFMLVAGAQSLVWGSVQIAQMLGVSQLVIGLTIIAAGTSLPEAATSIIASIRGERDIAIGNIVGSNIFNIFAVLGISSTIAPNGVSVERTALEFDIPVMVAISLVCLPIFFTGGRISRTEGSLLFAYYIAYLTLLILTSMNYENLTVFKNAMIWFVVPLGALGLIPSAVLLFKRQ